MTGKAAKGKKTESAKAQATKRRSGSKLSDKAVPDPGGITDITPEKRAEVAAQINRARDIVLARFAQVTMSFMGVPRYAHQSIKDLQHLAMVPLMRERIAIATVAPANDDKGDTVGAGSLTNPLIGIALWANVSEEVDKKIRDQVAAGVFPVKLNADDWTSGDIVWLLDVIAPSQKLSAQVLTSFKQVLTEKLSDRTSKDVKLHPIIKKMIGDEVLMKMGAREAQASNSGPAVKTKIVKPKTNTVPDEKTPKSKWKVN